MTDEQVEAGVAPIPEEWDPVDVRRLWCSVIQRAVDDCMLGAVSTKAETAKLKEEAKEWLFSEDEEFPSFKFLCDHLGLNHRRIQEAVSNGEQLQRRRQEARRSDDEFADGPVHNDAEGDQESLGSMEGV